MKKEDILIIEENGKQRVIKDILWKNLTGGITITLKNKTTVTKKSAAERQAIALERQAIAMEGILELMSNKKCGDCNS